MAKEPLDAMRSRLLAAFKCPKCGGTQARANTVAVASGGVVGALFSGNSNQFLCIVCEGCHFAEMYATDLTWTG